MKDKKVHAIERKYTISNIWEDPLLARPRPCAEQIPRQKRVDYTTSGVHTIYVEGAGSQQRAYPPGKLIETRTLRSAFYISVGNTLPAHNHFHSWCPVRTPADGVLPCSGYLCLPCNPTVARHASLQYSSNGDSVAKRKQRSGEREGVTPTKPYVFHTTSSHEQ